MAGIMFTFPRVKEFVGVGFWGRQGNWQNGKGWRRVECAKNVLEIYQKQRLPFMKSWLLGVGGCVFFQTLSSHDSGLWL